MTDWPQMTGEQSTDDTAHEIHTCPNCGEEGSDAVRTLDYNLACVNLDCRVDRFSIYGNSDA